MEDVTSSNILQVGWFGGVMTVRFRSGALYSYKNVSRSTYLTVLAAQSIGSTFNKLIKSNPAAYPFELVE